MRLRLSGVLLLLTVFASTAFARDWCFQRLPGLYAWWDFGNGQTWFETEPTGGG